MVALNGDSMVTERNSLGALETDNLGTKTREHNTTLVTRVCASLNEEYI